MLKNFRRIVLIGLLALAAMSSVNAAYAAIDGYLWIQGAARRRSLTISARCGVLWCSSRAQSRRRITPRASRIGHGRTHTHSGEYAMVTRPGCPIGPSHPHSGGRWHAAINQPVRNFCAIFIPPTPGTPVGGGSQKGPAPLECDAAQRPRARSLGGGRKERADRGYARLTYSHLPLNSRVASLFRRPNQRACWHGAKVARISSGLAEGNKADNGSASRTPLFPLRRGKGLQCKLKYSPQPSCRCWQSFTVRPDGLGQIPFGHTMAP
jgi:hypothetical protein